MMELQLVLTWLFLTSERGHQTMLGFALITPTMEHSIVLKHMLHVGTVKSSKSRMHAHVWECE